MSKKTYKSFNFWESATETKEIEMVGSEFFETIKTEVGGKTLTIEKVDGSSLLLNKEETKKQTTVFHEPLQIEQKKKETMLPSEKAMHSVGEDPVQNQKDLVQDLFDANGGQWKVLLCFVEKCLETGTLSTGYIKLSNVAKKTNLNEKTIHTAIYRLEKQKKLIVRQKGKEGAGGKSRFMLISEKVKDYILSYRGIEFDVSKHLNNEHGLQEINEQDEWKKIDISPLKEIGFCGNHLLQLKKYSTPQIVQESINQFSFGLIHNNQIKKYKDPLLVFMGVLRKGEAWIEKNYMSPSEITLSQLTEQRKNRVDKIKKMEEDYFLTEYTLWETSLTEQDKDMLLPEDVKKTQISLAKTAVLRLHFREKIWPNRMPTELINLKIELGFNYKDVNTLE